MKSLFSLSILTYYLLGTLCLPLGDFATLPDLPQMFHHCRATEDADLSVSEFFLEHLSGLGGLIEGIEHEEEEDEPDDRPHAPFQFHFQYQVIAYTVSHLPVLIAKPFPLKTLTAPVCNDLYLASYISSLFRPPIA